MSHFTLIVNCVKQSGCLMQYCKALRTAMYKCYINSKLLLLIIIIMDQLWSNKSITGFYPKCFVRFPFWFTLRLKNKDHPANTKFIIIKESFKWMWIAHLVPSLNYYSHEYCEVIALVLLLLAWKTYVQYSPEKRTEDLKTSQVHCHL